VVPKDKARIRVQLSATKQHLDKAISALLRLANVKYYIILKRSCIIYTLVVLVLTLVL
jgi:t-SNARE complex subunit (syntaxin)